MAELRVNLPTLVNTGGLDSALRAVLNGKCTGVSTYPEPGLLSVWLTDAATGDDRAMAAGICGQHDPIFLSVDKSAILANGLDTATITIRAPKDGAQPVTLLVGGSAVPITLSGGVGTLALSASVPGSISISVQNPANRSGDVLTIIAA